MVSLFGKFSKKEILWDSSQFLLTDVSLTDAFEQTGIYPVIIPFDAEQASIFLRV